MSENRSISGLTDAEAQEFHAFYVQGLLGLLRSQSSRTYLYGLGVHGSFDAVVGT